jgi:hypothetical protein
MYRGFMMLVSVGMLVALYALLTRTRIGLIIQAALTKPDMVEALGHNVPRIFMLVFGGGTALAGTGRRDRRQCLHHRTGHGGRGRQHRLRHRGGRRHGLAGWRLHGLAADRLHPDLLGLGTGRFRSPTSSPWSASMVPGQARKWRA